MKQNPERTTSPEHPRATFTEKLHELLPGIEFEESVEMNQARMVILDALAASHIQPELMKDIWTEYADICEQSVDQASPEATPELRAKLQIAMLIHKALIFREAGDSTRYIEELADAKIYAHNAYLDDVTHAIDKEFEPEL